VRDVSQYINTFSGHIISNIGLSRTLSNSQSLCRRGFVIMWRSISAIRGSILLACLCWMLTRPQDILDLLTTKNIIDHWNKHLWIIQERDKYFILFLVRNSCISRDSCFVMTLTKFWDDSFSLPNFLKLSLIQK
jgi:hypothetical protein